MGGWSGWKKALGLALALGWAMPAWGQKDVRERAAEALQRAVAFFRTRVAVQGSYLWRYSEDLKRRWGEGEATETQGWVQPPGTPTVGMAYLRAYEATGERTYLEAARETGHALAFTQLASGGWDYRLEFDPQKSKAWYYRRDVEAGDREPGKRRNISVYDDNNTQSALLFLMRLDKALEGKDAEVRRAVEYGLAKLLEAQYPNGAWPQAYQGEARNPEDHPILQARYPEEWPRTYPGGRYWFHYTFNDGAMMDILRVLMEAHRLYGKREYLQALHRGGEFILRAQMPEPQPAWAQQYNFRMEPAWARRFEPPAIAAAESAGVVRVLMELYLYTGEERYLKPIPAALAWFQRSRLPNGQWARFYELKTNRPLYFTKDYRLVYTEDDLPTHYSFQGGYGISGLFTAYERLQREGRQRILAEQERPPTPAELRQRAKALEPQVERIIASLDEQGRWVEKGMLFSQTFARNVETLAEYLRCSKP